MNSILEKCLNGQVEVDVLIKEIIQNFLETLLKAELTEFLDYEKYDPLALIQVIIETVSIPEIYTLNMVRLII